MDETRLPRHVAIVMDGNGRWAKSKGLPRIAGHKEGMKTLKKIVQQTGSLGIDYLTVYAFSTENWKRPEKEVKFLLTLLKQYVKQEVPYLLENNVRLHFLGSKEGLSKSVLEAMADGENRTAHCTGLVFNIAFNYGGRKEIVDAFNNLLEQQKQGVLEDPVDERHIASALYTKDMPDPELFIRTSGEFRLSNFLLWQLAYAEFYITEVYWPDFDEAAYRKALDSFGTRNRRFGGI